MLLAAGCLLCAAGCAGLGGASSACSRLLCLPVCPPPAAARPQLTARPSSRAPPRRAAGPRRGRLLVCVVQYTLMVGLCITYSVTAGQSLKGIASEECDGADCQRVRGRGAVGVARGRQGGREACVGCFRHAARPRAWQPTGREASVTDPRPLALLLRASFRRASAAGSCCLACCSWR